MSELANVGVETRLERRLDRWIVRAGSPRGAAVIIASASGAITLVAGLSMTIIDHKSFPTVGSGLWWSIQTVTTVGYGDVVPVSIAGRILAGLVMLLGIGFVTVITASITSSFVAGSRTRPPPHGSAASEEQLRGIKEQLERIEAALTTRS